jgi:hypothetical protein
LHQEVNLGLSELTEFAEAFVNGRHDSGYGSGFDFDGIGNIRFNKLLILTEMQGI